MELAVIFRSHVGGAGRANHCSLAEIWLECTAATTVDAAKNSRIGFWSQLGSGLVRLQMTTKFFDASQLLL